MKRSTRLGIAGVAAVSLGLATLTPSSPERTDDIAVPKGDLPAVDVNAQPQPNADIYDATPASRRLTNFGAWLVGALSAEGREARDNNETVTAERSGGLVTLRMDRTARGIGCIAAGKECGTIYTLSVTARQTAEGKIDPTGVTAMTVQQDAYQGNKGGAAFSLEATDVSTGWIVNATVPAEGDSYNFTANTGASLAEPQTRELLEQAADVVKQATN